MKELRKGHARLRESELEIFDCNSIEELQESVMRTVEAILYSPAVKYVGDAAKILSSEDCRYDIDDIHDGESVHRNIELRDGSIVSIRVTELYIDSSSDDYCYLVQCNELY